MSHVPLICPYCSKQAKLVTGDQIYPSWPDLAELNFYLCDSGHESAYVGCHPGTTQPLGSLANKKLRQVRSQAHKVFDPIWKSKQMTRSQAYCWLAERMSISPSECHIGMFDVSQCQKVIQICLNRALGELCSLN